MSTNLRHGNFAGARRLVRLLAGLLRRAFALYAITLFAALVATFFLVAKPLRSVAAKRRVARTLARLFFRILRMPLTAKCLDRLPPEPHILLVNHSSFLDAIVLTALLPATPGYTFTTRQEFRAQSLLCPILRQVHVLVLDASERAHGANIDLMSAALRRGESLVIFPEGGFVSGPGLLEFHSGAFIVASRTEVDVVTVGLRGTRTALPLGTWSLRRVPISIEIGPAFKCISEQPAEVQTVSTAARAAMLALCGEPSSSLRVDTLSFQHRIKH